MHSTVSILISSVVTGVEKNKVLFESLEEPVLPVSKVVEPAILAKSFQAPPTLAFTFILDTAWLSPSFLD
jgi:hypothetical protein